MDREKRRQQRDAAKFIAAVQRERAGLVPFTLEHEDELMQELRRDMEAWNRGWVL